MTATATANWMDRTTAGKGDGNGELDGQDNGWQRRRQRRTGWTGQRLAKATATANWMDRITADNSG